MYLKLTYLLIAIALLASSCNSEPTDNTGFARGRELSFNVSDHTRVTVTKDFNQFLVYGETKPEASGVTNPISIFNKTLVEYKNNIWTYDDTQYWIPNSEHSFVAITPAEIFYTGLEPVYLNSRLTFENSISESGKIPDILTATHRRLYVNNGTGGSMDNTINLNFSHLYSLINFAPALDDNGRKSDEYILFHKMEFSGITTGVQVVLKAAPLLTGSSTNDTEIEISEKENGKYSFDFPVPVKVENTANFTRLFDDDDALIMFPQTFAEDSEACVIMNYTFNGDTTMNQITIPLKNLKWESGKSHVYRFTIEKSGVKVDSFDINPWNAIQSEEITID